MERQPQRTSATASWIAVIITIFLNFVGLVVYLSGLNYRVTSLEELRKKVENLDERTKELGSWKEIFSYRLEKLEKQSEK